MSNMKKTGVGFFPCRGILKAMACIGFVLEPTVHEAVAQSSIQEWQAKAVSAFPELGVRDSPLNRLFLERVALLKKQSPAAFADPSWPYRLAVSISERPELLHPATGGAIGHNGAGGVLAAGIAELCVKTIKQRVASGNYTDKLEDWLEGDKVTKVNLVRALQATDGKDSGLRPALARWVTKIMESKGHHSGEDRLWLQAFLSEEKLHDSVAASVGLDAANLEFQLLGETESCEFVEGWLAGKTIFTGGSRGLSAHRLRVLEMVVRNRYRVGGLTVSENCCWDTLYAHELANPGAGFLLMDQVPLSRWPDKILTGSKLPPERFNAQKGEWRKYLSKVVELGSRRNNGGFVAKDESSSKEVHPGVLESYVLWKVQRMESVERSMASLEAMMGQVGKHPSAAVRDLRRAFPALAYFVRAELQKADVQ